VSEYQYYEFLALDRPLTDMQRAELRSISSRAEITATRFVNEYEWGDLKSDPQEMVERYFDAFLYLANWGTRRLMFRLPRGVLDMETAQQYCYTDTAAIIETDSHLILSLYLDRDPDEYLEQEPGPELAAMDQARSELAVGDLRLLYLAWLLALQSGEIADEDTEPPVPAGLGNLSASLQAMVAFFEIDRDLIAVAADSSPPIEEPHGLAEFLASVRAEEKDAMLARVVSGEGAQVQALLLRRFRAATGAPPTAPARLPAELLEATADRIDARTAALQKRLSEKEASEAEAKAAAYAKRLDQLAAREEEAWAKVAGWIETRKPRGYDLAVSLLRHLQAVADRQEGSAAFRKRLSELRAQHQRKPTLLNRLDQAGLSS
jgi:hypothetical protein